MGLVDITEIEILQGFFSLVHMIIAFIIGFKVIYKYKNLKQIEILSLGLVMIFGVSPYWINTIEDIKFIQSSEADAFLIGSSIMQAKNIKEKILELRGVKKHK